MALLCHVGDEGQEVSELGFLPGFQHPPVDD